MTTTVKHTPTAAEKLADSILRAAVCETIRFSPLGKAKAALEAAEAQ